MAQMDELRFRSILQHEIQSAVNYYDSEFSADRSEVLDYYLGQPFGNEVPNRSQVVATEVSDTIEYIMPSLMKMFASIPVNPSTFIAAIVISIMAFVYRKTETQEWRTFDDVSGV